MALTTIIPQSAPSFKRPQTTSYVQNGFTTDTTNTEYTLQNGIPIESDYTFDVIPAPQSNICVAPISTFPNVMPADGWYVPLQSTVQGSYPNITSRPAFLFGVHGVLLDCERDVSLVFSADTTQFTTATINGYDYRGVAVSRTLNVPVGVSTIPFLCPMSFVASIIIYSANVGAGITVAIGNNNYIGLPYLLISNSYVTSATWNNESLASINASITPGYNWRLNQAPAVDGDGNIIPSARGYVYLGTQETNGTGLLVVKYTVLGGQSELNGELTNLNQSSLKILSVQKNTSSPTTSPVYVLPYLVEYDQTGIQFVGNSYFFDQNPTSLGTYQLQLAS